MTIAAPTSRAIPAIADDVPEIRRSVLRRAWIFCRRQPLGTFGMVLVVIMAIAGITADWMAPYSPTANDFSAMTEAPSWAHWLRPHPFRAGPVCAHHFWSPHRADRRFLLRDRRQRRGVGARRRQRLFRWPPGPLSA